MDSDDWSLERSYLNHTRLSNGFRWALDPDRANYAEAAIRGMSKDAYPEADEQGDFEETKKRIDKWPALKAQILEHSKKVTSDFNPYSSGFVLLSSYISKDDILWLKAIVKEDMVLRFKLVQWEKDVIESINNIDTEMLNVRGSKSTIKELRNATDSLIEVFSGRGYFNYARSI